MSVMMSRMVALISSPPAARRDTEIGVCAPWLRKASTALKEVDNAVLVEIMRNCQISFKQKDDVIIKQRTIGDSFYMILSGSVSVFVDFNQKDVEPGEELETETQAARGRQAAAAGSEPLDRTKFGKNVGVINQPGRSFGEVALISDDSIRTASIISDEDSIFLVIHRDLYNKTLKAFHERDYADRRAFTESHPLFRTWPRRQQALVQRSLGRETYSMDCPIVRQGEPCRGLVFVRTGRVKVLVEPGRHVRQYPDKYPLVIKNDMFELEHLRPGNTRRSLAEKTGGGGGTRDVPWERTFIENAHVHVRRKEGYVAAEKRLLNRSIMLCLVEEGGIFGDIEMVNGLKTSMFSVYAASPTQVFTMSAPNVERIIQRKSPKTMESVRAGVVTKLQNRVNSVQGGHVPLMRHLLFKLTSEIKPKPLQPPPLKVTKTLPDSGVLFQHMLEAFKENRSSLIDPILPGSVYYKRLMQEKLRIRDNQRRRETAGVTGQPPGAWNQRGGASLAAGSTLTRSSTVSSIQSLCSKIAGENEQRRRMMEVIIAKRTRRLQQEDEDGEESEMDVEIADAGGSPYHYSHGVANSSNKNEASDMTRQFPISPRGKSEEEMDYLDSSTAAGHEEYLRMIDGVEKTHLEHLREQGDVGRGGFGDSALENNMQQNAVKGSVGQEAFITEARTGSSKPNDHIHCAVSPPQENPMKRLFLERQNSNINNRNSSNSLSVEHTQSQSGNVKSNSGSDQKENIPNNVVNENTGRNNSDSSTKSDGSSMNHPKYKNVITVEEARIIDQRHNAPKHPKSITRGKAVRYENASPRSPRHLVLNESTGAHKIATQPQASSYSRVKQHSNQSDKAGKTFPRTLDNTAAGTGGETWARKSNTGLPTISEDRRGRAATGYQAKVQVSNTQMITREIKPGLAVTELEIPSKAKNQQPASLPKISNKPLSSSYASNNRKSFSAGHMTRW